MTPNTAIAALLASVAAPVELPRREWFTVRDVATLTGRASESVRDWIAGRGLPASRFGTRAHYFVAREPLARWLEANPWALSPRERHLRRLAARCTREVA